MLAVNINRITLTGNLTKDPELRQTTGGTSVLDLRLAVNGRRKNAAGDWVDDPNFFDVTVFGGQAENCAQYLSKGRPIAVDGRLDWHEWEAEDGRKRQQVKVIADNIQFLSDGKSRDSQDAPAAQPVASASSVTPDDDIPF